MELEHLNIPLQIKSCGEDKQDEQFFTFAGYASTFGNVDLGNDIVEKGAFVESLRNRIPKLLFQHDMREPIGIFTEVFEDNIGLLFALCVTALEI